LFVEYFRARLCAWNGIMISEWWIRKYLKGSGHVPMKVYSWQLSEGNEKNTEFLSYDGSHPARNYIGVRHDNEYGAKSMIRPSGSMWRGRNVALLGNSHYEKINKKWRTKTKLRSFITWKEKIIRY
jgi:hypothetical protein